MPGAWHTPAHFQLLQDLLTNPTYAYAFHAVTLPSVGAAAPHPDWSADVAAIRGAILAAVERDEQVLVVAHSYGGLPAGEAIRGLTFQVRSPSTPLRVSFLRLTPSPS